MSLESCAIELYKIGAIKFGSFKLKSGIHSPIYIDLRLIISFPKLLKQVASLIWQKAATLTFDCICGVPYTALPIATVIAMSQEIPMVMRRKEAKEHGTKRLLEGVISPGHTCLVIEDLITSGLSIMETVSLLEEEGLKVKDAVVLLDREQAGGAALAKRGYTLHSVFKLSDLLAVLENEKFISQQTQRQIQTFLASNQVC
jgi:uridine monophosphate synthetase